MLVLCDHERATATTPATAHRRRDAAAPDRPAPRRACSRRCSPTRTPPTSTRCWSPGTTVAGAEDDAAATSSTASTATHPGLAAEPRRRHGTARSPTLTGRWTSGQWVAHVTGFFAAGGTRALVGTRGLLGEGWDAPAITTLIDLTTATTPTAVVQTRGRALRIDPARPEKVALIWSVVCVYEGHVAGANDWERYARKHRGYFTVDEHGAVADGVAGVDSTFSDYHPPPVAGLRRASTPACSSAAEDRATPCARGGWPRRRTPTGSSTSSGCSRTRHAPTRCPTPSAPPGAAGLVPWTVQSRRRPGALAGGPSRPRGGRCCSCGVVLGLPAAWAAARRPPRAARRRPASGAAGCAPPASTTRPSASSRRRSPTGCAGPASSPVGHEALHVETT